MAGLCTSKTEQVYTFLKFSSMATTARACFLFLFRAVFTGIMSHLMASHTPLPQVMAVNRSLVQQIDTLRLRLQVDTRHHDASRSALQQLGEDKLKEKDARIDELKGELRHKEQAVKALTDENHKKRSEIHSLQHTINALKEDVEVSKTYVEEIQDSLHVLQVIPSKSSSFVSPNLQD